MGKTKRRPLNLENTLKTKSIRSMSPARLALFGQPQLLPEEDVAACDQLFARIYAAVNPVDIFEEMFVNDIVSLQWEVLRWRRLKTSLIRTRGLEALERTLTQELDSDYDLYSEQYADELADILQDNLPEDQAEAAQKLARESAQNHPDADDKVNKILADIKLDMEHVLGRARARKAKELVQQYARHEPDAVTLVEELLAGAGASVDDFMADALAKEIDSIERIDRMTAIAESRRNNSLHEIERRRAVPSETLRRSVQEVEDGEFEEIEMTPGRGKNAA